MNATEEHLRTFGSPLRASLWAFEQLSRRGGYARAQLNPGPKGRVDWSEVEDLALTITSDLYHLDERICARVVEVICAPAEYARPDYVSDITAALAEQLPRRLAADGVKAPPRAILRAMALVALLRVRHRTLRPEDPVMPPVVCYAAAAGRAKSRMYDSPWIETRRMLEGVLTAWRDHGLNALRDRLESKGIVESRGED